MSENIFLAVGGIVIVILTGLAVWQARCVSARIEEYRRDEERQASRDPFARLAALTELTEQVQDKKTKKRGA